MVKDLIIEEPDGPEEVEKTKRKTLDVSGGAANDTFNAEDWDTKESTALVPKGGKPKFLNNPNDKHNVDEGKIVFITFYVEADPVPTIEWLFEEEKDLSCSPRAKMWTDGSNNTVTLGIKDCKQKDEGGYNCILTNSKGKTQFDFKLYVTMEGGMDFRAMLMKKKRKEKKVVVKKVEWIEPLVDQSVKQGKCENNQVVMTAKLSVSGMKGKWYMRNEEIMLDIKSQEHGRELQKGDKYDWKMEEDTYTLIVHDPRPEDEATYILLVKEMDTHTSGYLQVIYRDPEYFFVKRLQETENAFTDRWACLKGSCGKNTSWA